MNNTTDNSNYTYKTEAIYRRFIKNKNNSRFYKYKINKKKTENDTDNVLEKKINTDLNLDTSPEQFENTENNAFDNSKLNVQYINNRISELFIEYQN